MITFGNEIFGGAIAFCHVGKCDHFLGKWERRSFFENEVFGQAIAVLGDRKL